MNSDATFASLSKLDELYSAATVAERLPANSDIPDGEYDTIVEDVTLTTSSASTPMISWALRIRGGPYSDQMLRKLRPVSQRSVAWVKEDFIKCGLKLEALSDLPNRIAELRGKCITVVKKTGGNSDLNVHIQWTHTAKSGSGEEVPF